MIATLFRRYHERMFLTARTLLHNPEEAHDVVSDVFAELLESDRQLDMQRVESYLMVSVRNKCLNLVKHRTIEERAQRLLPNEPLDEDYKEIPLDDILHYIENDLTPQTREVMLLRYGKDKRYNEIAADLGISRIAVYKHIARALTKLKKHFLWITATFICILLVSGIAFAAIHFIRSSRNDVEEEQKSPTHEVQTVNQQQPAEEESNTPPRTIIFEDAELQQIIDSLTIYYKVKPAYRHEEARHIRLYYEWDQRNSIEAIAREISHFERISISMKGDSIIIE